ncbi:MAG TPA: hypothetical protein VJ840_18185 [Gemmatimonadaceae bacterium]|nr:hypothetical protein [Gemmatimonadaceae bacterium]
MRFRLHRTLAFLALMSLPATGAAQSDTRVGYDSSALRLEWHFGDMRIVRGLSGPIVGSVGVFHTPDLVKIVEPSENAVREAREFKRNHLPGSLAAMVGGLIVGASIAIASRNDPSWELASAELVGAGLALYGGFRLNRAYNALSKSIWWYNRDLRR